jgi:hypothetical protein
MLHIKYQASSGVSSHDKLYVWLVQKGVWGSVP